MFVDSLVQLGPTLPALARSAIEHWLRRSVAMPIDDAAGPAAPVFVSLHRREGGQLRGCMGTLVARESNVRFETRRCAVLAAIEDPRFEPLELIELGEVTIDVTVLCPLESISGPDMLDPKRYGVVVSDHRGRRGVLLPDLPGIDDVASQLSIVRRKAGIDQDAAIELQRFEALRYFEP